MMKKASVLPVQLFGTWHYGKKHSKYNITRTEGGGLRWEGPFKDETISGILKPVGQGWQAELFFRNGQRAGSIQIRLENGKAISNFKTTRQDADWGKDIIASREGQPMEEPASVHVQEQPPQQQADPEEPLVLVGECNKWNVASALRRFHFTLERNYGCSRLRIKVDMNDLTFQVLSAEKQWNWRLYPSSANMDLKLDDKTRIPVALLWGHDHRAAEHRNFHIRGMQGRMVDIWVQVHDHAQLVWCTTAKGDAPKQHQATTREKRPNEFTISDIEPLQLVGPCCKWKIPAEGLDLVSQQEAQTQRLNREYRLCFQMNSRNFEFQIVSQKLGFKWRLFPQGGKTVPLRERVDETCSLGGEEDGHSINFEVQAQQYGVYVLSVFLSLSRPSIAEAGQELVKDAAVVLKKGINVQPRVGIASIYFEYPPKQIIPLDYEYTEAAQTDEEKAALVRQRTELVRKISWQLQQEYSRDDVQQEILELRRFYPYHKKKSVLALEFDASSGPRKAIAGMPSHSAGTTLGHTKPDNIENSVDRGNGNLSNPIPVGLPAVIEAQAHHTTDTNLVFEAAEDAGETDCLHADCAQTLGQCLTESSCESVPVKKKKNAGGLAPIEKLKQDLGLRLQRTQEKIQRLEAAPCNDSSNGKRMDGSSKENLSGATQVLLQQAQNQEKAFRKAMELAEQFSSADDAWSEIMEKFNSSMHSATLVGDADAQWNEAMARLPSVIAARRRVMETLGIPQGRLPKALWWTGEYHSHDMRVFEANTLAASRLRIFPTLHPDASQQAAAALRKTGSWVGSPELNYHLLDVSTHAEWMQVRAQLETIWTDGFFKEWFGGPKAGRYFLCNEEDMYTPTSQLISGSIILMKDQLRSILAMMGEDGKDLEVESQAMVSFHGKGDSLPPWIDNVGKTRRLTYTATFSIGQTKVKEGGALRLRPHRGPRCSRGGCEKMIEVPAGGGHTCVFYSQEFKQEISQVRLPCGRWAISICAELPDKSASANKTERNGQSDSQSRGKEVANNFVSLGLTCDCCSFAAGDGVSMACPSGHRVCRECLQTEIRRESVSTCPACIQENDIDRIDMAAGWDLLDTESIEDFGCVCPQNIVDPGAKVLVGGQSKGSNLNGKLAEAVWWSMEKGMWEVRVFATGQTISVPTVSLHTPECCMNGGSLSKCPCWPLGRGLYPISLGCRCCVKQGIMDCSAFNDVSRGYPYFHGNEFLPFDWNLTSLDGILYFLRHDFANYFHFNNVKIVRPVNRQDVHFDNYTSSMMSFLHHSPVKDRGKLEQRIRRWRVLCNHSREVRAARTMLFIRYLHESSEFSRIDELYSLLRLWAGGRIRLCIVAMLQTPNDSPKLYRHANFPRVLIYLAGHIDVMDFVPFRTVCRFAAYDEAGLLNCDTIDISDLPLKTFRDPYTTMSPLCLEGDWLDPLQPGQDHRFFPDCPSCRQPWQGQQDNQFLTEAVRAGNCDRVNKLLWLEAKPCLDGPSSRKHADPNSWNTMGWRPLHHAVGLTSKNAMVRIVASLLLARADPRCRDAKGASVLDHAERVKAPPEVCALLRAAVLSKTEVIACDLYKALEIMGEPVRSRLARILDIGGLRPLGEAEFAWRNPTPDSETFIDEVEEVLGHLERLPEAQRKKEMKRLLLEWHPDKNGHRHDLATAVFQYLQANKDRIIKR